MFSAPLDAERANKHMNVATPPAPRAALGASKRNQRGAVRVCPPPPPQQSCSSLDGNT